MEVTKLEKELIDSIRNYRNSYPNGERNQRFLINELLMDLMDADDSPRNC